MDSTNDGDRCSIVTLAAVSAMAGRASRPSRRCRSARPACRSGRGRPARTAGAPSCRRSRRCPASPACSPRRSGSSPSTGTGTRRSARTSRRSGVLARSRSSAPPADQSALTTRWWKRIFLSTPYSAAVSRTYRRMSPPAGDCFRLRPRPEREAQGEHVRVGADAGEPEQVPGAADGVAGLEDREAACPALGGRRQAAPMPDRPAPTIRTSVCCGGRCGISGHIGSSTEQSASPPRIPSASELCNTFVRCITS